MAILSATSSRLSAVHVGRSPDFSQLVVTQTITRPGTTQLFTVTLGAITPTTIAPGTTSTATDQGVPIAAATGPSGLSQEALGGIIGAVVSVIVLLLVAWACCGRVRIPKSSSYGSSTSRTMSNRSSRRTNSSSSSPSGSGSDATDEPRGDGPGLRPGQGPMHGGHPPGAAWGGPMPGMGQPPGVFPMNGMGRGGPPMMSSGRGMPLHMPMPMGRGGPPPPMPP